MLCGPWLKSSQKQHSLGTLQSQPQLLASCQTPDCDLLEGKSFTVVDGRDQRWMKKPQEVESIQFGTARQGVKFLGSEKADLLKSSPAPQLITFTGSFSPTLSASLLPYGGSILPSTRKAVNMARNNTHNVCWLHSTWACQWWENALLSLVKPPVLVSRDDQDLSLIYAGSDK